MKHIYSNLCFIPSEDEAEATLDLPGSGWQLTLRCKDEGFDNHRDQPGTLTRNRDNELSFNGRLRNVLLRCPEFATYESLTGVFADPLIAPWKHYLRRVETRDGLVDAVIELLWEQRNEAGTSALALFLQVLSQRVRRGDARKTELTKLAHELAPRPRPDASDV